MGNKTETNMETWEEMKVRESFENYDGTLIGSYRMGTNQLPAEEHSFVKFDISTKTELLKEIEERIVKPVNDYFIKKNGSEYINSTLKLNRYKGCTDVSSVLDNIFFKALEEFEMFAEEDNLWEREVEEQMGHVDSDFDRQNSREVA